MSSMADQLKRLGLKPVSGGAQGSSPQRDQQRAGPHRSSPRSEPDNLSPRPELRFLEFARFGRVTTSEEGRGFGLVREDSRGEVFFHFSARAVKKIEGGRIPNVGEAVVFALGSDPRRSDAQVAIRWLPVAELGWPAASAPDNQERLDHARERVLEQAREEALLELLKGSWYSRRWREHGDAPADLEDAVLERVLYRRLASASTEDLKRLDIGRVLRESFYRFARELSPQSESFSVARMQEVMTPAQAAALGAPDVNWMDVTRLERLRAFLMEWYLRSSRNQRQRDEWALHFTGEAEFEIALAAKLLEGDTPPDAFVEDWLARMSRGHSLSEGQAREWVHRWPSLSKVLFERLPWARQVALVSQWREKPERIQALLSNDPERATSMVAACAVAFDLETDGEHIWEIGCAHGHGAELLHAERDGTSLEAGLTSLQERLQHAPVVVGHNVVGWDWPVFASRLGIVGNAPVLWDTLLVQYLLQPQAASHALGANHRAGDDALAALELFKRQLSQLPSGIAGRVLLGDFATTADLLATIGAALENRVDYARERPPLTSISAEADGATLLVPEPKLREFDWVPGVVVVAADEEVGLGASWREIDPETLAAHAETDRPAAIVMVAVARLAAAQGIPLRRNMIPVWLLEADPGLSTAVDVSAGAPRACEGAMRVSPLPERTEWWGTFDPERHQLAGVDRPVLVAARRECAWPDLVADSVPRPLTSLSRVPSEGSPTWAVVDPPAQILSATEGVSAFRVVALPQGVATLPPARPLERRPILALRSGPVLHPRARDQFAYWSEVLRGFREVSRECSEAAGRVPVLLVGSSRSRELVDILATALAELGMAEPRPAHRSQREHLRRAARRGYAVVGLVDQWEGWQAHAGSLDVTLQPFVEALPLEEWFACMEAEQATTNGASAAGAQPSGQLVLPVEPAAVLEKTGQLIELYLHAWLAGRGIGVECTAVILDPRLTVVGPRSSRVFDELRLSAEPLPPRLSARLEPVLAPFRIEREEAPAGVQAMERFLLANWQPAEGKGNRVLGFKPSQLEAMKVICERASNVLVTLPTGEGKSVLFQVPALCRGLRNRRLTLVISPLKALMRDQVERLREQGFHESADYLSGDRTVHEVQEVLQGVLDHRVVLLYVAPERLRSQVFLDVLDKRMQSDDGLEHVVVDEAHCVNQWGHQFRPDYFNALQLLLTKCNAHDSVHPTQFLLLSATVTASDRERLGQLLAGTGEHPGSPLPLVAAPDGFFNPLRAHIAVHGRRVRGYLRDWKEFDKALGERMPHIQEAIEAARSNRRRTGQRSAVIVFVSTRDHAERVAGRIARECGGEVDYYHAGLDAEARDEVYSSFRGGHLDVLVATKAFGMGMDIPDIHWVIHLSPPGYLDDYLQEVGRIGRGEAERRKAGLQRLPALLLYSNRDFEAIRALQLRNALTLPLIKDLHRQIEENANLFGGRRVAVVPAAGYASPQTPPPTTASAERAAQTRMRMTLYWLERAGRLQLGSSIPDLMPVSVNVPQLTAVSRGGGAVGEVAKSVLALSVSVEDPSGNPSVAGPLPVAAGQVPPGGGSLAGGLLGGLGRLLEGLLHGVGMVLGRSDGKRSAAPEVASRLQRHSNPAPVWTEMILNLAQLKLQGADIKSMGDVLAALGELAQRGALTFQREVHVSPRSLASEEPVLLLKLIDMVDGAVAELIRQVAGKPKLEFTPFELAQELDGPQIGQERRAAYERAFLNGFRALARAAGVKLRQRVQADEKIIWEAVLPRMAKQDADHRRRRTRAIAESLFQHASGKAAIPLPELMEQVKRQHPKGLFREADFVRAARLLSALRLLAISTELVPMSHVVTLSEVSGPLEQHSGVWDDLRRINAFAAARILAMEVFANVDPRAHEGFIKGYFGISDEPHLREFLGTQLGEVTGDAEDEAAPSEIQRMRDVVRATRAQEFFETFKASEEPAQWDVVRHPFDGHLLVNAGPGAGKTRVLVGRIAHLIREQNIDPSEIVVLAFNRAVVFEIRNRIRELFQALGYAAYARRLRVSTFHSLAIRSLARHGGELQSGMAKDALPAFAEKMRLEPTFARAVGQGVRCILVDEFQDVTDDIYSIIYGLYRGSGEQAGVMVIGDDDQDILRWNRAGGQFSERYFERFESHFGDNGLTKVLMGVNFRSCPEVVELSQSMISAFFERSECSKRMKTSMLRPRKGAIAGTCERVNWHGRPWERAVSEAREFIREMEAAGGSIAMLCRSNSEVAEVHRCLAPEFPELAIEGAADLRLAHLRNVGAWLDFLREVALQRDDPALGKELKEELDREFARLVQMPELMAHTPGVVQTADLWRLCEKEHAFPHLSSLIRFAEELRTDDYARLLGSDTSAAHASVAGDERCGDELTCYSGRKVVTTLHKVKGLEFDNVIILPSAAAFPFAGGSNAREESLAEAAAEEARMLYVGMTRAKKRLVYFRGDREVHWGRSRPVEFAGTQGDGKILVGSMEEVFLSWPLVDGAAQSGRGGLQAYVERQVAVGDPVCVGLNRYGSRVLLLHKEASGRMRPVGQLARRFGEGDLDASLKVSAVVRFTPEEMPERATDCVRERGWGYVVLVSGRLR